MLSGGRGGVPEAAREKGRLDEAEEGRGGKLEKEVGYGTEGDWGRGECWKCCWEEEGREVVSGGSWWDAVRGGNCCW